MTCEQCREFLSAYLTGDLTPAEQEAVRAHLAGGCPECAGALVEAQAAFAMVGLSLEPLAPPARARDRLMAWVRATQPRGGGLPISPASPAAAGGAERRDGGKPWRGALAVAACLALVAGAGWHMLQRGQHAQEITTLQRGLAVRDARLAQLQSLVTTSQLSLIALGGQEAQPEASGRVFWDKENSRWHVFIFDMKPPPPGKEYELWFVTAQEKKVPAGTFGVDADGRAELIVQVPPDLGPLALAAITDEPLGGVPQPTGAFQLIGKIE